ncbi:MAG: ComEC family competence protein, partial [Chloroflexi bacterium]
LATYNDQGPVTLEGVVIAEPDVRDTYINLRLRVDRLEREGEPPRSVRGLVLVRAPRFPLYAYGDRLRVTGSLETPPASGPFSYRDYLARRRIYSWIEEPAVEYLSGGHGCFLYRALFALKARAQTLLARLLPDPEAALLTGILLGVDTGLPRRLSDDFSATGTTHIIAISGFNISLITGLLMGTLGRLLGRRWATGPAIVAVLLYTILVGADAAVVRAALMGVLYILGRRLGRPTWAVNSLAVAVLGMSLLDPFVLWDVGFQLSVAATLGLMVYTPPLEGGTRRLLTRWLSETQADRVIGLIGEALLVTTAAQITTTPILLYHFHRLSPVTLLTNFLILPAQQGVMLWGGTALLLAFVWFPLGQPVAWVAWLFLTYTIRVVQGTARLP